MYQEDYLRNYIKESELRVFNDRIKVRLSRGLAIKYDLGVYTNFLTRIENEMKMLDKLKIKYPANAKPILYIYVVPDDNYKCLLYFLKIKRVVESLLLAMIWMVFLLLMD